MKILPFSPRYTKKLHLTCLETQDLMQSQKRRRNLVFQGSSGKDALFKNEVSYDKRYINCKRICRGKT